MFAALKFKEKYCKEAKIHILGIQDDCVTPLTKIICSQPSAFGAIHKQIRPIEGFYTGADMVITPQVIATRTVRESLASGVPLVAGEGNKFTSYAANPKDVDAYMEAINNCWTDIQRNNVPSPRKTAEKYFQLKPAGEAIKKIFEKILNRPKSTRRKVFIDIGAHLGQSVKRFYKEVDDADCYEIFCFEPEKKTFEVLSDRLGKFKNVTLINKAAAIKDGTMPFFVGRHNQNEGGTIFEGKVTGGVDYKNAQMVESIDFSKWLKENVSEDDYVVIKINAEGGEYPIMGSLLINNITHLIDQIYIQLHAHKFKQGKTRQDFQKIESAFWNEAKCEKFFKNKGFERFRCELL
jgi:FkbM family methyltransferase